MDVGSLSREYYNIYSLSKSDTYAKNKVDSSAVSKEDYDVSDLSSALEAMDDAADTDFSSIGDISGYTENALKISQSSIFSKVDNGSSIVNDILSGSTNDSSMYGVLTKENENLTSSISGVISAYGNSVSSYSNYLSDNSSIDTSV